MKEYKQKKFTGHKAASLKIAKEDNEIDEEEIQTAIDEGFNDAFVDHYGYGWLYDEHVGRDIQEAIGDFLYYFIKDLDRLPETIDEAKAIGRKCFTEEFLPQSKDFGEEFAESYGVAYFYPWSDEEKLNAMGIYDGEELP